MSEGRVPDSTSSYVALLTTLHVEISLIVWDQHDQNSDVL